MKRYTMNAMNSHLKRVFTTLTVLAALTFNAMGQGQVKIMVSPKYDPMPPSVLNYVGDPGKYFQISLENISDEVLNVYLGLELQQVTPSSGLSLSTPPEAMPQQPLVLLPHKLQVLDVVMQKQLFRHLNVNQLRMTGGVLSDYTRGIIGLLPEGTYSGQITAYRYQPGNRNPEVLSDPIMGHCMFNVCYSGSAPRFLQTFAPAPSTTWRNNRGRVVGNKKGTLIKGSGIHHSVRDGLHDDLLSQTQFDLSNPRLEWTPPMTACAGTRQYRYSLRVVKAVDGQTADEAMLYGADVYRRSGLMGTYCVLPTAIVQKIAHAPGLYVCQVTAEPIGGNVAEKNNYVLLQNGGKSELLVFNISETKTDTAQEETTPEQKDTVGTRKDSADALKDKYLIAQPVLKKPHPDTEDVRTLTLQTGDSICMAWKRPVISEALVADSDTISLNYKVEAWKWQTGQDEDALKQSKPFYEKNNITELADTISWNKIDKALGGSGRIRLRVTVNYPFGNDSIVIGEDEENYLDLTFITSVGERFPDCHPGASDAIKDKTLGDFSTNDLKDKTVKVGDFEMTVTKIEKTTVKINDQTKECYKGTGYVTWMLENAKIMINVKFDTLFINKDRQVYDGKVVSAQLDYNFIPYDLFDKWGLDFFGSVEKYGLKLNEYMAKEKDVARYYKWLQDGCMVVKNFINSEIGPLTLPLKLPKEINRTPIDIQILKMEFSPNSSWMNLMGLFVMPESDYTRNDVLVFGAPRQCIAPNKLFAEAGCLSLLSDVTVKDPGSQYAYTFKAPRKPSYAEDGCYVNWDADTLSSLAVDMEVNIPHMMKDDGKGNALEDVPYIVNVRTRMRSWSNWTATVAFDPFQVKGAPGYTFVPTGKGITFDHSTTFNTANFKLPKGYDLKKLGNGQTTAESWEGFYFDEFTIKFPTIVEVTSKKSDKGDKNKDKRLSLSVKNLYFDASGISFNISANNIVEFGTGKLGGWSLSLDEVYFDVLQNSFNKVGFNGKFGVPLLKQKGEDDKMEKGKIGYECSMSRAQNSGGSFKYTFKTQQVAEELIFDAFLAKMKLDKDKTHFFVESENNKTRVELCMGGEISISGTKDKTFMGLHIPGVAFSGFRLANFKTPDSKRSVADNAGSANTNAAEGSGEKKNNVESDIKNSRKELAGESVYEYASPNGDFFFSLGQWKLASPRKKLGSFSFTLDDIGIRHDNKLIGLELEGSIGFMDDKLVAGAGVVLWGKIDLKDFDFDWDHCQFTKAIIKSGFGGVNVEGVFEMSENKLTVQGEEKKTHGYKGGLKINMKGLFDIDLEGSWGEAVRTKASGEEDTYAYSAFSVALNFGVAGIEIPPVRISGISGGFFINTDINKNPKYKSYGGMFGLTISTTGSDKLVTAPLSLTVIYDKDRNKLSNFIMQGDVYALYAENKEDALIKAKARFAYLNEEKEKSLTLNISVDANADMSGEYEKLTGKKLDGPSAGDGKADMNGFDANNSDDSGDKAEASGTRRDKESAAKLKMGVQIPIELKFTMKPDNYVGRFDTKWHFYLGKPQSPERCVFTYLDFQVGKSSSPVYLRCKHVADAYLCLGNELPDNGQLPPLPTKVQEFLSTDSKVIQGRKATVKEFQGFQGEAKGGVMLGASITGELALNAVVCYADIEMIAGFDLSLKKLKTAKCGDGRPAGKNGYYANGQIYGYAFGEMGLMLNLWIFKGKLPIIEAGVGAVLKGGLPNPAWAYGKVKAKAKLLGGLVKFNGSIELKAGHVCMPTFTNPLDDINIFEDVQPGKDEKDTGWGNDSKVSVYTEARYTTNMTIDRQLRLVDEKAAYDKAKFDEDYMNYAKQSERVYVFHVDPAMKLEEFNSEKDTNPSAVYKLKNSTTNKESFTLTGLGRLNPNKFYKLTLSGYAKELRGGKEVDPVFNDSTTGFRDVHRAWRDTSIVYFRTGELPVEITQDVKLALPENKGWAYLNEASKPILSLCGSRSDKWKQGYQVQADLEVYNDNTHRWEIPDQKEVNVGCTFNGEFYPMNKNGKAVGLDEAIANEKAKKDGGNVAAGNGSNKVKAAVLKGNGFTSDTSLAPLFNPGNTSNKPVSVKKSLNQGISSSKSASSRARLGQGKSPNGAASSGSGSKNNQQIDPNSIIKIEGSNKPSLNISAGNEAKAEEKKLGISEGKGGKPQVSSHGSKNNTSTSTTPAEDTWKVDTVKVVSYEGSKCRNIPMEEIVEANNRGDYKYIIWQLANNASFGRFVKAGKRYRLTIKQVDLEKQQRNVAEVKEAMKVFVAREQPSGSSSQSSNKPAGGRTGKTYGGSQKGRAAAAGRKGRGRNPQGHASAKIHTTQQEEKLDLGEYMKEYQKELSQTVGLDSLSSMMRTFKQTSNEADFTVGLYQSEFNTVDYYSFAATQGRGHYQTAAGGHKDEAIYSNLREVHYNNDRYDLATKNLNDVWSKDPALAIVYWSNYGTIGSVPMKKFQFSDSTYTNSPAMKVECLADARRDNNGHDGVYNLSAFRAQNILMNAVSKISIKPHGDECVPDAIGSNLSSHEEKAFEKLTEAFDEDLYTAQTMMYGLQRLKKMVLKYVGSKDYMLSSAQTWENRGKENREAVRKKLKLFCDVSGWNKGQKNGYGLVFKPSDLRFEGLRQKFMDHIYAYGYSQKPNVTIPYIQILYIYGLSVLPSGEFDGIRQDRRNDASRIIGLIDTNMTNSYVKSYDFNVFKVSGYNIANSKLDVRPSTLGQYRYIVEGWKKYVNTSW